MERSELKIIEPPQGVTMYVHRWDSSGYFEQYGLTAISEGLVESADSAPDPFYVPGTLLHFSPSRFSVRVTRLDLEAEEINRIGQLTRQIERTFARLYNVPKALKVIDDLKQLLIVTGTEEGVVSGPTIEAASAGIAQDAVANISALGTIHDQLQASVTGLNERLTIDSQEATDLGVSLIRYDTRSIRDGVFSPKRYIAQLPKAETATS